MTQATYIFSDGSYFDRIELESYRKRLEAAHELAASLQAGANEKPIEFGKKPPAPPAGVIRHRSYYDLASEPEAEDENCRLIVTVEYDDSDDQNVVELAFQSTDGLLGFEIREPLAADLFNYLEPSAPIEKIVAIVARWSDWLERVALPADPLAEEMHETMNRSCEVIVELLQASGHDALKAIDPPYAFRLPSPFQLPQVYVDMSGMPTDYGRWQCFTPAGQAMLAKALPTVLRLRHYRSQGALALKLDKMLLEEIYYDNEMSIIDRLKMFSSLPDSGSENLFEPLPEGLSA